MRGRAERAGMVLAGLLVALSMVPPVAAQEDTAAQVRVALQDMHRWLGGGANGQRWRVCLQSDRLQHQLQRGDRADPEVLAEVLAAYERGTVGLECPRFDHVRAAAWAWLEALAPPTAADLPALARQAKADFTPVTSHQLAHSKRQLALATERLDRYLTAGGTTGAAWKEYLQWDQLQQQLAADAAPDLDVLGAVYQRFTENHEGLELGVFSTVAAGLRQYSDLVALATLPRAPEQFGTQMEILAASLERYARQPTEQDHRQIGQRLGWLQGGGQAPRVVRAVRRVFSHANLCVRASARMLDAGMHQPIDRVDPLTDVILGTRITGTTHLTGALRVQPIPCTDRALLVSVLAGTASSDTVGRNGPALIYSDGLTNIRAVKPMQLDGQGIRSLPASSQAVPHTTVRAIAICRRFGNRLLERIAWRRVGRLKPQADAIAARRAEQRINRRFDAEAASQIAVANDRFLRRFRNPLVRRRIFPQRFHASTARDSICVDLLQATRYQLGAPAAPPPMDPACDLALRVHESLVNNLAASLLAGRTFTEEHVQKMAVEMTGELPPALRSAEDEDPWAVTFAPHQPPLTITFADEQFKLVIRGRHRSGEHDFAAMDVTVVYKVERTETGTKLTRQGDLEILPPGFRPGQARLNPSQVALRRLLTRRLGELLKPEIASHGLELPGAWKKVGKLQLAALSARDAWLVMGWKMRPAAVP